MRLPLNTDACKSACRERNLDTGRVLSIGENTKFRTSAEDALSRAGERNVPGPSRVQPQICDSQIYKKA